MSTTQAIRLVKGAQLPSPKVTEMCCTKSGCAFVAYGHSVIEATRRLVRHLVHEHMAMPKGGAA